MRTTFTIISLTLAISAFSQIGFEGSTKAVIAIDAEASTGLDKIYVIDDVNGIKANYTFQNGSNVKWYRYSNLGGAYAEEITESSMSGNTSTITLQSSDMGYMIEDGSRRICFWVVNYSSHRLDLDALSVSPESQCDRTVLDFAGNASRILYYTINGAPKELSRELTLSYRTLGDFDREALQYTEKTVEETLSYADSHISCQAPLCNTEFTLSGDRFLRSWGEEQSVSSQLYNTPAVSAETSASQTVEDYDNQQKPATDGLGGSAPCEITFTAVTTDAVVFREWQFSHTPDFEDMYERYNTDVLTHVFDENGTTYVRFYCANDAGNCSYEGEVYTVDIGESRLECPNAFSPANQDGVNDLWKVSYQSIVSFECHIFNRWGKKLATLNHPSQGWDGKIGGKFVPSGVYYYVIKARGADGKKYNLSGDINIINSRANPRGSTDVE